MTYPFDLFLHPRKITEIYGPPGTGKTQFCITAAVEYAKNGGDVVYIGNSIFRFHQVDEY